MRAISTKVDVRCNFPHITFEIVRSKIDFFKTISIAAVVFVLFRLFCTNTLNLYVVLDPWLFCELLFKVAYFLSRTFAKCLITTFTFHHLVNEQHLRASLHEYDLLPEVAYEYIIAYIFSLLYINNCRSKNSGWLIIII